MHQDTPPRDETVIDGPATMSDDGQWSQDSEVVDVFDSPLTPLAFGARYKLDRRLGLGGVGEVSLHRDGQIGRRVAMKTLRPEHAAHSQARARFVREARIQGQLEHPSVVPVYDLGVSPDGRIYFTMKRVRGETLEDIIESLRRGRGDAEEGHSRRRLLSAFGNVCLAVDYAHKRGVLHRDLKPNNIMLGEYGEVYVLDWGLARSREELALEEGESVELPNDLSAPTVVGSVLGTPGYMSPEQWRGEHDTLRPTADVYALGAILFELLTLEPLHPRDDMNALIDSTLTGADARASVRAPRRDIPPELDALLVDATGTDPKDRLGTARELYERLERFLDGEQDEVRRRELSIEYAQRASQAAELAWAGEDELTKRRDAMREVGRALALDPSNRLAMNTLVELLGRAPEQVPREVELQLDREQGKSSRKVARLATWAYASLILYLPLVLWLGVRNWVAVGFFYALAATCTLLSHLTTRVERPQGSMMTAVMVASTLMFASTAMFFGPLVVTPTLIAVNTTAFSLQMRARQRMLTVVIGCLTMLAVVALSVGGVIPGGYDFSDAGMTIRPDTLGLPELPSVVFMTLVAIAAVITSALSSGTIRSSLNEAEQRLHVHSWQMDALAGGRISPEPPA